MGSEPSKPTKTPQEQLYDAIFKMKMASKRFARESRKAEKEKSKNLAKAEKCLLKGDEAGAKLYVGNAQNNLNDYKKYLTMSSKLDAMAAKIKSNSSSQEIMQFLARNVTPAIVQNADQFDIKELSMNMEKFQEAFDKMTVNTNIMNENFNQMTNDGNTVQQTDELFQQLKNKVENDLNKDFDGPQMLNETTNKNKDSNQDSNKALEDYINDLKSTTQLNNNLFMQPQYEEPFNYEDYQCNNLNFAGTKERVGFFRKVMGILLAQILFTVFMILCSIFSPGYREFYRNNFWLMIIAIIVMLATMYIITCTSLGRQVPQNYLLLGLFTLCEGYTLSYVGFINPKLVFLAAVLTAAVTCGLFFYAMTTQSDLTQSGGLLSCLVFLILGLVIVQMFVKNTFLEILICSLSVIMYSWYIIYDVQLILGTKSAQISIDDYVVAALMLYIDIIGLFVELLRLLQLLTGDDNQLIQKYF